MYVLPFLIVVYCEFAAVAASSVVLAAYFGYEAKSAEIISVLVVGWTLTGDRFGSFRWGLLKRNIFSGLLVLQLSVIQDVQGDALESLCKIRLYLLISLFIYLYNCQCRSSL